MDPDASPDRLEPSVRRELTSLPPSLAEKVAAHVVMAGRLLDDEPELALDHARVAHDLAPRIVSVREALAITAYHSGDYRAALREARTVRRMTGDDEWLPVIADCERGLGKPERALEILQGVDFARLPDALRAECLIVLSGARSDLGQPEAALGILDCDLLRTPIRAEWAARLRLAYSEALTAVGRADEADRWLRLAAASDPSGDSGSGELLAERDDVQILDAEESAEGE